MHATSLQPGRQLHAPHQTLYPGSESPVAGTMPLGVEPVGGAPWSVRDSIRSCAKVGDSHRSAWRSTYTLMPHQLRSATRIRRFGRLSAPNLGLAELALWRRHGDVASRLREEALSGRLGRVARPPFSKLSRSAGERRGPRNPSPVISKFPQSWWERTTTYPALLIEQPAPLSRWVGQQLRFFEVEEQSPPWNQELERTERRQRAAREATRLPVYGAAGSVADLTKLGLFCRSTC